MKNISKNMIKAASVTGFALTVLSASPVMADGTGQISGGNIYRVKNITQNVDFANPASANACDNLEYSIQLHNSGYVAVNNVDVKVNLPSSESTSNTSSMTATYQNGVVPSTSASTLVNLSSVQSISYVNGSAQLLDHNGNVIRNLQDGVTSNGVNVGNINGSTTEFVNFEAKVSCPSTPPVTPPTTPSTPATPASPAAPTQLVNTGAGSVIGIFAAATAVGAFVYRVFLSRRLSRQ